MRFSSRLIALACLVLTPTAAVFALGVSPGTLHDEHMIAGKVKIFSLMASRAPADYYADITSKVEGAIAPYVKVINADNLKMKAGVKEIPLQIQIDATQLESGKSLDGFVTFKEIRTDLGETANTANLPGVRVDLHIDLTSDETTLLTIDSTSLSLRSEKSELEYFFTQRNARYTGAQVKKIKFIFEDVEDSSEKIDYEVPLNDAVLDPGEMRQEKGALQFGHELAGNFKATMEFYDQNGVLVATSMPSEMVINKAYAELNRKKSRYIFFIVGALCIAGVFMLDYFYLKGKYRRRGR